MDAMECLLTRDSAAKLTAPAPDRAALAMMLDAAMRAPDHGRLRPWRFVVIEADRREAFGEVLAGSLRGRDPDVTPEALQREREKALRAPMILVVAAHLQRGHKIPVVEQLAAVSAAAQTVLLAAHAQGYGAVWKTGAPAYDAGVRAALGLGAEDEIVGFLYLGTRVGGGPSLPRPPAAEFTRVWEG